jgi:hypothetical protein
LWRCHYSLQGKTNFACSLPGCKKIKTFSFQVSPMHVRVFQIGMKNQQGAKQVPLSRAKAVALVKDVFTSAAERDIHTGDAVVIQVITKQGVTKESFPLRRD